ncbi:MAG: thiamine-monophosphate kinase [Porticoccaceae bacterium]|nr:MAG: thiamine-monophosphate kinase [Porticoccaceae bacterium]
MTEFELIRRHFAPPAQGAVRLGVGDDCALVALPPGELLAATADCLVAGVHFFADGDPALVARRALRVNLSDLAAMGARPLAFLLCLTLPEADEAWLAPFAAGLAEDARAFACPLAGGDTTRGPLQIAITALGAVAEGRALTRGGGRPGDLVGVSGALGAAALAVRRGGGDPRTDAAARYWLPEPRLALGRALAGEASAAVDLSDGLLQDLGHLARSSGLAAVVEASRLPLHPALAALPAEEARLLAATGGDDYELCFAVPPERRAAVEALAAAADCPVTWVGRLELGPPGRVRLVDGRGAEIIPPRPGYDHFAPAPCAAPGGGQNGGGEG